MTRPSARATVVLDGRGLTSSAVAAAARAGASVRLTEAARARNAEAAAATRTLIERGGALYGATTGVGPFRDHAIAGPDRAEHQLRLLRSHAGGAGDALAPELVRATMVVRANQIGAGGAGVADELLTALVAALNAGIVPLVREYGSLDTGDLSVLAEIALALLGEGRLWQPDLVGPLAPSDVPAAVRALRPQQLGPRDGIAFMSSNAAAIGRAALVSVDVARLSAATLAVAAVSFEAAGADRAVLDPRVHDARPHPGQRAAAAQLRALLGEAPGTGADQRVGRPIQDPYAFRVVAQVEGVMSDALVALERVLAVELNAAAENALIAGGEALPNGNFHAGALTAALDALRAALAQSASLVAGRVSALLDPSLTGLPAMLSAEPGVGSGAMMLEYTAHAVAADVRSLTSPLAAQTTSVAWGVEHHASFTGLAARRTEEALAAARIAIATELVLAVRALRLRGLEPLGDAPRGLFDEAARRISADMADRPLGDDVEAARELLFSDPAQAVGEPSGG